MLFEARADLFGGLAQQRGQQLRGTHTLPAMNPPGVHGVSHSAERVQPSVDVDVGRVNQSAIDIEEDRTWLAGRISVCHPDHSFQIRAPADR
jgi:hypothetical protein